MNKLGKFSRLLAIISLILCFAMLFCACNTTNEGDDDKDDGKNNVNDTTGSDDDAGDDDTTTDDDTDDDNDTTDDGKTTYTVNVKDLDGNPIAGVEVQFCVGEICNAPVLSDANGVASVTLDPDDYHVKINPGVYAADPAEYEFEEGSTTLDVIVYKLPDGSAEDPIPVTDTVTQVKLVAGAKKYYTIFAPEGKILTIENEKAVVEYKGTTYTAENGKVEIALVNEMMATVAVSTSDGKLNVFNMKVESAPGTMGNPYVLEKLDPITVKVAENSAVYYTWTASANGTLTVSCANTVNDITINNVTSATYGDPSDGGASVSMNVSAGDEVTIIISTVLDMNTWTSPAAELEITFTLA